MCSEAVALTGCHAGTLTRVCFLQRSCLHICRHTYCNVVMLAWHIEMATCFVSELSLLPLPSHAQQLGTFFGLMLFWVDIVASRGFLENQSTGWYII